MPITEAQQFYNVKNMLTFQLREVSENVNSDTNNKPGLRATSIKSLTFLITVVILTIVVLETCYGTKPCIPIAELLHRISGFSHGFSSNTFFFSKDRVLLNRKEFGVPYPFQESN